MTKPALEAKKRWAAPVSLLLAAAVVLAAAYILHIRKEMTDFGVCYQGGKRIVRGETLYREADGHLQFKYSPPAALFFAPWGFLPYEAAKASWYILELAFLAGVFLFGRRLLPEPPKRAASVFVWTFLIELKFLARELELGQVNLLILFVLTLTLYFLIREKELAAGLMWGSSLLFKPYALVFFPYFLLKKKIRPLVSGVAVLAAGLVLPAIFYGLRGTLAVLREWSSTLSKSTSGLLATHDNASLYGFLLKIFPFFSKELRQAVFLLVFFAFAAVVLWLIRAGRTSSPASKQPEALEGAFLLILMPIFSPLGWNYNYLYSLLAVMLIFSAWRHFPPAVQVVLIINFAIIGTSLIEIWGQEAFRTYTHYALVIINAMVVLGALVYLRSRSSA